MTAIGFTGTRNVLPPAQYLALRTVLADRLRSPADRFHHGDCEGADSMAHDVARSVSHARIVGHPPDNSSRRAFKTCDMVYPERPYLVRNRNIVDMAKELIACPDGPETQRSGTWSTIRYARKVGIPVTIIWPDGAVSRE